MVPFQFSHGENPDGGLSLVAIGLMPGVHALERVAATPIMPNRPPVSRSLMSLATARATIRVAMPMYEFDCGDCGERFEDLVAVGTERTECRLCGSEKTERVLSAPGAPWKLVKTVGAARQQEVRNAKLHADTKAHFKETRKKAREAKKGGGKSTGGA